MRNFLVKVVNYYINLRYETSQNANWIIHSIRIAKDGNLFCYVVFENQIEKFRMLYLENVIETVNRVVITGICTFNIASIVLYTYYHKYTSLYYRLLFRRCAGSNASCTFVAATTNRHRPSHVQCSLHHFWTARDPE